MGTFNRRAIPDDAVESFWLAADGHRLRRIDWRQAGREPRGSILFLPGRGDFYEKYLETLAHWAAQGWNVTASDWRGQAGSGRLGKDAVTGHIGDFGIWIADLGHFWRQWIAQTPGPHVIAGHSMGGHLVLRAVAERTIMPDGAILSAPMLGFLPEYLPGVITQAFAKLMAVLRGPTTPAWKWSEKPGEVPSGREFLLTHDMLRYADELWWRDHRPELVMGPGSWRWVERSMASARVLERHGLLESVDVPIYFVAAAHDKLVSPKAINKAVGRLPHAEMLLFGEDAYHEILREADPVRDRALAGIDSFLDRLADEG